MRLQTNAHHVGLYCRLSRDDGNSDAPSMSIENQKKLLLEYATEKEWNIYDIYIDDGFTGTNFNRPDFKRMKQDIEDGKIDCVITKDLSRLGRNFSQTGYYTDEYFPDHGVRYIAINDNQDTADDNNDMMGFYHVMNELYPKQVSRKVKQVKKADARQGKFIGGQTPYGYKKLPDNKYKLVIDEEAAPVVRRIFAEFAIGESARAIADKLTNEGVDCPRIYQLKMANKPIPIGTNNVWISNSIYVMLRNQVYIGNMVQGKRAVVSFKTKRRRVVPQEDWVVVENMHDPLISPDVWSVVQRKAQKKPAPVKRLNSTGEVSLFSGVLKCADCGSNLAYSEKRLRDGSSAGRYRCQGYLSKGKTHCTPHGINGQLMIDIVLGDIRKHTELTQEERTQIAAALLEQKSQDEKQSSKQLERKLAEIEQRLAVTKTAFKKLYEDRINGVLPEEMFSEMMASYKTEQEGLQKQQLELSAKLETQAETEQDISKWLELIAQHEQLDELDRTAITSLIEYVEIKETFDEIDMRHLELTIYYRFIGKMPLNAEKAAMHGSSFSSLVS